MTVSYTKGALDGGRKAALARRLTEVMLRMEGGAHTPQGYGFANVVFAPLVEDDWWVGGEIAATPARFLVRVDIPEGYMDQAHKHDVHTEVTAAVAASSGEATAAAHTMVIVNEITEGNWGAAGATIGMDAISAAVGLPKTSERFGWVRDYFAAKARQFRAAGYPVGVGGLMAPDALRQADEEAKVVGQATSPAELEAHAPADARS